MLYEEKINLAIDLLADDQTTQAESILQEVVGTLVQNPPHSSVAKEHFFTAGFCLELLEEFQQSLLQYEKALQADPSDDDLVWTMVQIMLFQLEQTQTAIAILQDRLLKSQPENEEFLEALRLAQKSVRTQELQEILLDPEQPD
jgi:tetratricopeptide (TPR) repeat protein